MMKRAPLLLLIVMALTSLLQVASTPKPVKPPIGAQIRWGDPITEGLVEALVMNEGGGRHLTDLVKGRVFTGQSSAGGWAVSSQNTGPSFVGAANYRYQSANTYTFNAPDPNKISFAVGMMPAALAGRMTLYTSTAAGTAGGIQVESDVGGIMQTIVPGTFVSGTSTGALVAGRPAQVIYSRLDTGDNHRWMVDGRVNDKIVLGGEATAYVSVTDTHYVGERAASQYWNGHIYYIYWWNRPLSIEEANRLAVDPYCFLTNPNNWLTRFTNVVAGATANTSFFRRRVQ